MKERLKFNRTSEEVEQIGREVLHCMPKGWVMKTNGSSWYFKLTPPSSDYDISVSLREAPTRYNAIVDYIYPNNMSASEVEPDEERARAGTNFQLGPKAIAQAIIDKLIPVAEEKSKIVAANVQKIYQQRQSRQITCDVLASLFQTTHSGETEEMPLYGKYGIWKVHVNHDGSTVKFEMRNSFPTDKAYKLIEFLRDNGYGE